MFWCLSFSGIVSISEGSENENLLLRFPHRSRTVL